MPADPEHDDVLFERLAATGDPADLAAPERLRGELSAALFARQQEDTVFETIAAEAGGTPISASLKSRIYSGLVQRQAVSGPLLSLTAVKQGGRGMCLFEELVRIAPVGEALKSRNPCRVCHARVLGERMTAAPIYWPHCPYSQFHNP